jgi:hypothetical protein
VGQRASCSSMDQPVPMRRPLSALAEAAAARLDCYCGGYWTAGGVRVRREGDTAGGGDADLSCMKLSSSSCPTALWSCGEWIDGLGEVLDLKKTNKVYTGVNHN